MTGDTPPPSWYEPPDEPEDDEPDPLPEAAEMLVIAHGIVWWHATADD